MRLLSQLHASGTSCLSTASGGSFQNARVATACMRARGMQTGAAQEPSTYPPDANRILIWWSNPSQVPWQTASSAYESMLTEEELVDVRKAASETLRQQRLLSKVLTRTSLATALGGEMAPQDIRFQRGQHGKPVLILPRRPAGLSEGAAGLSDRPLLQHNISHTNGLVGCAVTSSCPVGIDLEQVTRRPNQLLKLAKRRLSQLEYDSLSAVSSDDERAALFVRLWTLKEAYLKCRGTGINAPPGLKGFSMGFGQPLLCEESLSSLFGLPLGNTCPLEITLELANGSMVSSSSPNETLQSRTTCLGPERGASISRATHKDFIGATLPRAEASNGSSRWKFLLFQPR